MATPVSVNCRDTVRDMELSIKITGYRRFRARVWIGTKLINAGIRIIGCNGAVERE